MTLMLMLMLLGIAAAGGLSAVALRARMDGMLILTGYGEGTAEITLRPWPLLCRRTKPLIGVAGVLLVCGSPRSRRMWVWLRLAQRSDGRALAPGDRLNLVGLDIAHARDVVRPDGRR